MTPLGATDFFEPASRNSRARLAVAVELMRELSRYSDPLELSRVFAKRMNQLYPTARQITLSRRGTDYPRFRITRYNLWKHHPDPYRELESLPILSGGLFGDLVAEEQPRVIDELQLEPGDPASEFLSGQGSLLSIPIFEAGKPTTALILAREEQHGFAREQIPELVWLTNLFGRATQTLVLSERLQAAYDTADYELRTIAEFQQNLLPTDVPNVPGLEVAVHYRTANRAGGDYYDFFPLPDGKLGVLVADVSGHGTPAAMLMAVMHSLTHALSEPPLHPGEFLSYLNQALAKRYTLATGHFATAVYAVFDPKLECVTFASAGHEAPRARLTRLKGCTAMGQLRRLPLGVTHRSVGPYPEQVFNWEPGDSVALFTDGIPESVNSEGEPFGHERLEAVLNRPFTCCECAVSDVVGELETFTGSASGADDRTLVLVGRTHPGVEKLKAKAAMVEVDVVGKS